MVSGARAQEEEVGFGLSRAQIPPLLAMSAFPISSEQAKNSSDRLESDGEKKGARVREQERKMKKHFIRWIPPHSVNILQVYIRPYVHCVRYTGNNGLKKY